MSDIPIEIIIDDLVPISQIKLVDCCGVIFIKQYDITRSTLSYKLNSSTIYNLLMEQLYMNDSLIMFIIDNIKQYKSTIVVNSISMFNYILYKLDKKIYTIHYYGLNLNKIPIYSSS